MGIEEKTECNHWVLVSIGLQERPGKEPIQLGNCLCCNSTRSARLYRDIGHGAVELDGRTYLGRLYVKTEFIYWGKSSS